MYNFKEDVTINICPEQEEDIADKEKEPLLWAAQNWRTMHPNGRAHMGRMHPEFFNNVTRLWVEKERGEKKQADKLCKVVAPKRYP